MTPAGALHVSDSSGSGSSGGSVNGPVYDLTTADGVSVAGPYLIMGSGTQEFPYEAYLADVNNDGNIAGGADIAVSPESTFALTDLSVLGSPIGNFSSGVYTEASSSGSGSSGGFAGSIDPAQTVAW